MAKNNVNVLKSLKNIFEMYLGKKKPWNIIFMTHYHLSYTQKYVIVLYFFALSYLSE